jgi:prepilin-type N-terminal cleavage/methylation domain-containing protein
MLKKLQTSKDQKGFTIIEVMIVLAIAGLIILVVLLAVPALQRNSRNTAIKNDASAVAAAVTEFSSNNDGKMPTGSGSNASTYSAGTVTIKGGLNTTEATAKVQGGTNVTFTGTPAGTPSQLVVLFKKKCSNGTSFTVTDNSRATAVLYNVETSGSVAPRCVDA